MSAQQEMIDFYLRIENQLSVSTMRLMQYKEKLGYQVIVSDSKGMPVAISATEAIERLRCMARH